MADIEVGQRFGCWTVLSTEGAKLPCKCDCGIELSIRKYDLLNKKTTMCKRCSSEVSHKGHGASDSDPTYSTWLHMRSRCTNPSDKDYPNYGGRGITVCSMWLESYESFLMCMGPRPKGCTLDRTNHNGNYEPGNCTWASIGEQNRNTRSNIRIELNGKTMVLSEWIRELGLEAQEDAIRKRIERNVDPVVALTKSVKSRKKLA